MKCKYIGIEISEYDEAANKRKKQEESLTCKLVVTPSKTYTTETRSEQLMETTEIKAVRKITNQKGSQ